MRTYYIYIQRAKLINSHMEYCEYMWLPFELFDCVTGTKELYDVFKDRIKFNSIGGLQFNNSLSYNAERFCKPFDYYMIWENKPKCSRFVIVDDKGVIRDFYELTHKYKKKSKYCCGHKYNAYQERQVNNASEKRKILTPEEIREVKDKYGITLLPIKPKRKVFCYYGIYDCKKYSKGWKQQTKRKKQYKVKG